MEIPNEYVYCEAMTVEGVCYSHAKNHLWVDGGAYHHKSSRPAPPPPAPGERIAAAAILEQDIVFTGAHHHQIIRYVAPLLKIRTSRGRQGFITNLNRFVGRAEAAQIAFGAGQVDRLHDSLMSEMLFNVPDWVFVPGSEKSGLEAAKFLGDQSVAVAKLAAGMDGEPSAFQGALILRSEIMMDCAKLIKEWVDKK